MMGISMVQATCLGEQQDGADGQLGAVLLHQLRVHAPLHAHARGVLWWWVGGCGWGEGGWWV